MAIAIPITSVDYSEIPLVALKYTARSVLSQFLNGTKVIPSPSKLPRDWRGIAYIARVVNPQINCPDPTDAVFKAWERNNPTFQNLLEALKEIDRWDIIDEIEDLIKNDAIEYQKLKPNNNSELKDDQDPEVLTLEDVYSIKTCGRLQYYDAFLLYHDSDREFSMQVLNKLENEYGMKLCIKDRNLIGGLAFEHEAIMQLLKERCRRLIVIISPLFLQSPVNTFFLSFAQALGIEQRQRKIIPCIYTRFSIPLTLNYYFILDYTRNSPLWSFWDRLNLSVTDASATLKALPPAVSLTEPVSCEQNSAICQCEPRPVEEWECNKVPEIVYPSAPLCQSTKEMVSSFESLPCQSQTDLLCTKEEDIEKISKTNYSSSEVSVCEGSSSAEPLLRTSKSPSFISKVLSTSKKGPKDWFKKRKKLPVALQS